MQSVLVSEPAGVLVLKEPAAAVVSLDCEGPLRVAAATLARALPDEIRATRVVGVLGRDELPAFQAFVKCLVDEFGLEASVRVHGGSFSVRLCRPSPST